MEVSARSTAIGLCPTSNLPTGQMQHRATEWKMSCTSWTFSSAEFCVREKQYQRIPALTNWIWGFLRSETLQHASHWWTFQAQLETKNTPLESERYAFEILWRQKCFPLCARNPPFARKQKSTRINLWSQSGPIYCLTATCSKCRAIRICGNGIRYDCMIGMIDADLI